MLGKKRSPPKWIGAEVTFTGVAAAGKCLCYRHRGLASVDHARLRQYFGNIESVQRVPKSEGPMKFAASVFVCAILIALAVQPSRGQEHDKDSVGVTIGKNASAKETGLPIYPGSKPHKTEPHDSGANLGLWGGGSGFKLAVMKMETSDAPDKVAAFYKKALSKYGTVLDCTNNPNKPEDQNSKALTCGTDKPEVGGMIFKAGTKDKQHIVGVEPNGKGTVYNLVYVSVWGSDKRDSNPQ